VVDVLTPEQPRLNMSRNRGRNTKPEVALRTALHKRGLRYRLHRRDLPGNPDLVFPSARVVVFVDGCFWHGCPLHGAKPATNVEFWEKKLAGNVRRDRKADTALAAAGWHVVRIWEHEIRSQAEAAADKVCAAVIAGKSA
jgi:DNA mismatch endonuclease (patch repair protein)